MTLKSGKLFFVVSIIHPFIVRSSPENAAKKTRVGKEVEELVTADCLQRWWIRLMEEVGLELRQEVTTGESEYTCVGTGWVWW